MRVMCTVLSGGSRFCGAWSLDSFGDPLKKKEYKIRYNIEYLFRMGKKSKQITNLQRWQVAQISQSPEKLNDIFINYMPDTRVFCFTDGV